MNGETDGRAARLAPLVDRLRSRLDVDLDRARRVRLDTKREGEMEDRDWIWPTLKETASPFAQLALLIVRSVHSELFTLIVHTDISAFALTSSSLMKLSFTSALFVSLLCRGGRNGQRTNGPTVVQHWSALPASPGGTSSCLRRHRTRSGAPSRALTSPSLRPAEPRGEDGHSLNERPMVKRIAYVEAVASGVVVRRLVRHHLKTANTTNSRPARW